jgi:predicted aconitase
LESAAGRIGQDRHRQDRILRMGTVLSGDDRARLEGDRDPAAALAMRILICMSEILGAKSLPDIRRAPIESTIYIGEVNLESAERLTESGARVAVPTTLNVCGLDEHGWRERAVPQVRAVWACR